MGHVDWRIQRPEVAACNRDWGRPCQLDALPTHGLAMLDIGPRGPHR